MHSELGGSSMVVAEELLQPWFDSCITPTKSKLWVSAVAPNTFQGSPRFLSELMKRPLEHPDAMGRRRGSARYGTCLIAHVIANMELNPSQLYTLLERVDFLRHPDILLKRKLPQRLALPLKQYIKKGYNPTPQWEQLVEKTNQTFQKNLKILTNHFGMLAFGKPIFQITSYFAEEGEWWGATRHPADQLVNITPPFLLLPPLLGGLLYREAVRHLVPSSFYAALDTQELANIIIADLLEESQLSFWQPLRWGGPGPPIVRANGLVHLPILFEQLKRQNRLFSFLKRLNSIDQLAAQVETGSLTSIAVLELEAENRSRAITDSHKQVLLSLSQNPQASERQLTTKSKLARTTVRRSLKHLRTEWDLKVVGEVNYSKVGLTPLLLTISHTRPSTTLFHRFIKQLQSFPYCMRLLQPLGSRDHNLIAILTLPPNALPTFEQLLHKHIVTNGSIQLTPIIRFGWGWHFRWWRKFNVEEWKILAQSKLKTIPLTEGTHSYVHYQGPPEKLTKQGLRVIITLEENMRRSIRQLHKSARISETTAWTYKKEVLNTFLTPRIHFIPSSLPETFIFSINTTKPETINHIIQLVQLLPFYQIFYLAANETEKTSTTTPAIFCAVSLPRGGLIELAASLPNTLALHNAKYAAPSQLSASQIPRIRGLPLALFNSTNQEWLCGSKLFEALFSFN